MATPSTPGAPTALIAPNTDFSVSVALVDQNGTASPVSTSKDTTVAISVDVTSTAFVAGSVLTATVPAGKAVATFTNLRLTNPANAVTLTVRVTDGSKAALALKPGTSQSFDIVVAYKTVPVSNRNVSLTVSPDGVGVPCFVDATVPTCAELVLPNGVDSDAFFSTGLCDTSTACPVDRVLLQVLADVGTRYTRTSPATVIVTCDKSLCSNGGVPSFQLRASLDPTGPLSTAPACKLKGVINADASFCVDYVQSTRDNAGDLHLYLLLASDARMSCC